MSLSRELETLYDIFRPSVVPKASACAHLAPHRMPGGALEAAARWPDPSQVCRIERRRRIRGEESVEVVHVITSLTPERVDATRLLELSRAHWGIENRLHWCGT